MGEDKGVIQGWQQRRWGINVLSTALTWTCDQHCPGLWWAGVANSNSTWENCTAFPPPPAGALWLPVTVPLHWANASMDAPSSEQLSVCPGKWQEQGKAMPKGEMCWLWLCSWLEAPVCLSALSGALEVLGKQSRSLGRSGMYRKHWTWKTPARLVLLWSAPVLSMLLSFPKWETAGQSEGSGSSSLQQGVLIFAGSQALLSCGTIALKEMAAQSVRCEVALSRIAVLLLY